MNKHAAEARSLLNLIPTCPLVDVADGAPSKGEVWMDDAGDLRFVARCNDQWGPYSTFFVKATKLLRALAADAAAEDVAAAAVASVASEADTAFAAIQALLAEFGLPRTEAGRKALSAYLAALRGNP